MHEHRPYASRFFNSPRNSAIWLIVILQNEHPKCRKNTSSTGDSSASVSKFAPDSVRMEPRVSAKPVSASTIARKPPRCNSKAILLRIESENSRFGPSPLILEDEPTNYARPIHPRHCRRRTHPQPHAHHAKNRHHPRLRSRSLRLAGRDAVTIPYSGHPHFPQSTVVGHSGKLVLGTIGGVPVAVMQGRVHAYEGYPISEVVFPARVLGLLGIKTLIVTNAAGGIREAPSAPAPSSNLRPDQSHRAPTPRSAPTSPASPPRPSAGQRFFDMSNVYTPRLRMLAVQAADTLGFNLTEGVYLAVLGPSFETPAEIRAFRTLGADLVGMSTVHEVIVARHMGLDVLGLSLVTNMAAGVIDQAIDHEDVLEIGRNAEKQFTSLLTSLIPQIAPK